MAFEDPVVWVLFIAIFGIVVVGFIVYFLVRFLHKANKYMDAQMRKQKEEMP